VINRTTEEAEAMPAKPAPRDERITAATLELLRTKGPKAVTVEAVAARAGVAKTTIYRRYRNREDMLAAALTSLTDPAPPTDRSALRPILEWLIDQSRSAIEGGIGVGGVAELMTEEDPAFTELIRSLLVQHRKALADVVADPAVSHLLRDDLDVETLLDSIAGAYLAERGRRGGVAPGWAERVLQTLWPAVAPPGGQQR
jgi:AcrR family transcriptional regulator